MRLRRSDTRHMQRARNRTLRLTIIIVLAFFWCWTPYVTMVLWYQFGPGWRRARERVPAVVALHVRRVQLVRQSAGLRQLLANQGQRVPEMSLLRGSWRQDDAADRAQDEARRAA
ncbi:unnamed protein product [Ixodes hexagonus]